MQVNKVKNKKKFQPLFDWNCEIEDPARKEKESTLDHYVLSLLNYEVYKILQVHGKLVFFNGDSELSTIQIKR